MKQNGYNTSRAVRYLLTSQVQDKIQRDVDQQIRILVHGKVHMTTIGFVRLVDPIMAIVDEIVRRKGL